MSFRDRLVGEINTTLDRLAKKKRPWRASWIAHEVCKRHTNGLAKNDDADFWRYCGYAECRDEVRRAINKRTDENAADNDDDRQKSLMPGFDHLQRYYVVERENEEVGVPVELMSDEEIDSKIARYRAMGAACFAHADELVTFRRKRAVPDLFRKAS